MPLQMPFTCQISASLLWPAIGHFLILRCAHRLQLFTAHFPRARTDSNLDAGLLLGTSLWKCVWHQFLFLQPFYQPGPTSGRRMPIFVNFSVFCTLNTISYLFYSYGRLNKGAGQLVLCLNSLSIGFCMFVGCLVYNESLKEGTEMFAQFK